VRIFLPNTSRILYDSSGLGKASHLAVTCRMASAFASHIWTLPGDTVRNTSPLLLKGSKSNLQVQSGRVLLDSCVSKRQMTTDGRS
jgi:hypothetical protein